MGGPAVIKCTECGMRYARASVCPICKHPTNQEKDFIENFVRDNAGAWRCVSPAELQTPQGRIQIAPGSVFTRGTKFMNVDLATLLDEQRAKDTHRR